MIRTLYLARANATITDNEGKRNTRVRGIYHVFSSLSMNRIFNVAKPRFRRCKEFLIWHELSAVLN